jgi:hypothetical protein
MDQVRLIEIAAFLRNPTPANDRTTFDGMNRSLKSHYFEVLLGRYAHLLTEQVDEVLL